MEGFFLLHVVKLFLIKDLFDIILLEKFVALFVKIFQVDEKIRPQAVVSSEEVNCSTLLFSVREA